MLIGCFQPFQLCTRKVIFLAKISACTCTLFILNTFRATMFSGYLIIVSNTFSKICNFTITLYMIHYL